MRNDRPDAHPSVAGGAGASSPPAAAVLLEQSLAWGLICRHSLEVMEIPHAVLSAADVAGGALDRHRLLIAPGGWASHKSRALGREGARRVRAFIERGGSYLGLCGGAGLALTAPGSLGLVELERLPMSKRVPNVSGEIHIEGNPEHPIWSEPPARLPVPVWWPAQFGPSPAGSIPVARYGQPAESFRVADLRVEEIPEDKAGRRAREAAYGINLNPGRLIGETAIVEIPLGRGRVMLSYPHPETPDFPQGNLLFKRLVEYLVNAAGVSEQPPGPPLSSRSSAPRPCALAVEECRRAAAGADALIAFGERLGLWRWRLPWLLDWQRGVRGLEYGTLSVMTRALAAAVDSIHRPAAETGWWLRETTALRRDVEAFRQISEELLTAERAALEQGPLPKLGAVNESVDCLRRRLFGSRMSHAGLAAGVLDRVDRLTIETTRWGAVTGWHALW